MVKSKAGSTKISYSVRVDERLIIALKHLSVDEKKSVSELIEEGISTVLEKRKELKA